MTNQIHIPILVNEIIEHLEIDPNDTVLDATMGFGGHSSAFLSKLSNRGKLIGIDRDLEAVTHCKTKFKSNKNVHIAHSNFDKFPDILNENDILGFDKCLADLGISSFQIDSSERGFSYLKDEPLDMRMNAGKRSKTCEDILNTYTEKQLSDIFFHFGELRQNKILSQNIVRDRKKSRLKTTEDLMTLIKKSYYFNNKRSAFLKTSAKVFQALRIEVNQELEHLDQFLTLIPKYTKANGRVAFLSFHSLEDRRIKQFFNGQPEFKKINKKVITASQEEIDQNSRAKSAKLRVYLKVS